MFYEIIGPIRNAETFAIGTSIHDLQRLRRRYGRGRWRKRKGVVLVRLADGSVTNAEVHWYEASGIGKKEIKVKQLLWD
jgi:hypothetical protein